jgi:hypothetical protein
VISLQDDPGCPTVAEIGVAIKSVGGNQRHIGLIYRSATGEPYLAHLAWHLDFRNEPYPGGYFCGSSCLDEVSQQVFSAWLETFCARVQKISYGINSAGVILDSELLTFDPVPFGKGLTCATFVLALFERMGYQLLDAGEWATQPEDQAWQLSIIEALGRNPDESKERLEAMATDVGCFRFRPEQVAAGVLRAPPSLGYKSANELAAEILETLSRPKEEGGEQKVGQPEQKNDQPERKNDEPEPK